MKLFYSSEIAMFLGSLWVDYATYLLIHVTFHKNDDIALSR